MYAEILTYCASHNSTVLEQVSDPGCRRFLMSKHKVQTIRKGVKTRINSDLPSIRGRSMAIEFPWSIVQHTHTHTHTHSKNPTFRKLTE